MRTLTQRLLLVAALVFGQWAAVAHASEHHALVQKHACEQCLHAQALDVGAVSSAPTLSFVAAFTAVANSVTTAPGVAARHRYRSRAPPQISLN